MKTNLHQLKKTIMLSLLLLAYTGAFSQTATVPTAGDGTEGNPYQIATLDNLYWLTQTRSVWNKYFIQTVNINASGSQNWDGGKGFKPIGNNATKFTGSYNGKGHSISNVYINRTDHNIDSHVGFFGYINNGTIDSLGLSSISVTGSSSIGAFASYSNGVISHCYTSGNRINGSWSEIAGFVSSNYGTIKNSYSNINIHEDAGPGGGAKTLGGLVAHNVGTIENCYSTGDIYGNEDVGALVGKNNGTINNCYSTGYARGFYGNNYGGIAGYNYGRINYCYSTGGVGYHTYHRGGVVGENRRSVKNSFYELESDGGNGKGGTGLTASEMKNFKNYLDADWDFIDETHNGTDDIWGLDTTKNNKYPFLKWQEYTNTEVLSCQAPLSSSKKIVFDFIQSDSIRIDSVIEGGYITEGYVIMINTNNSFSSLADGSSPSVNTVWQNSGEQYIYFGSSNNAEVTVTNLDQLTNYYLKVFTYRICGGTKLFESEGLLDSATTKLSNTVPAGLGTISDPYKIANMENLTWLMYSDTAWDKHYIQTADINASETYTWYDSTGFKSIGKPFTGTYNGKGHCIDSIYINKPATDNIGFFGSIGSGALIDSLGLTNLYFVGKSKVGGLTGTNDGTINNSYTTGVVKSKTSVMAETGGLVGRNNSIINYSNSSVYVFADDGLAAGGFIGYNYKGHISNSYCDGDVYGRCGVGGFVGENTYNSVITNCYSAGKVSTSSNYSCDIGGFNSRTYKSTIINCFWDTQTSGQSTSNGGKGLTTAEMKNYRNYLEAAWDFMNETYNGTDDVWGINSTDNNGYPFLAWQRYIPDAIACQAPLSPAKKIFLENVTFNSIEVDSIEKAGYGTIGYAIYIDSVDTWTVPVIGTTPTVNSVWQNDGQQCIYLGISTKPEVIVTGLSANKKYYFKVYAYNDCSGTKTYVQTGPGSNKFTRNIYSEPSGNGSASTPYVISNLEELTWLVYSDTVWNKQFIQSADINAAAAIEWEDSAGFVPIGNSSVKFSGIYNGKGYKIDSLHINRESSNYLGLFGITNGAKFDSLGLTNVNIKGNTHIGGLVGSHKGSINNCYSEGTISGYQKQSNTWGKIGGLVGENNGSINNSYSSAIVDCGMNMVGGLVGWHIGGVIKNCYTKGDVTGYGRVGGIVGDNRGTIRNCYSNSSVSGNYQIGGLVGFNPDVVQKCYSKGSVTGNSSCGGLIGSNGNYDEGRTYDSFWDVETSGQENSDGGVGKTSSQMKTFSTYLVADWDFINETYNGTDDIWGLNSLENNGYPFLKWEDYTHTAILDCQAPLTAAGSIAFKDIKADSITLDSVTPAGYITVGYTMYINSINSFIAPADDITPTDSTVWLNEGQQCIYFGTNNKPEIIVSGLDAGIKYFFKIFAYNECTGVKKYEQQGVNAYQITVPAGEGTETNPYKITNLVNLEWLMNNSAYWDKHYIQTANIDAKDTKNWDDGKGFTPIGNSTTKFSGIYNGKGFVIDSLFINRPNSHDIGFFGRTNSSFIIDSLGLCNVNITGNDNVGSLVAYNNGLIRFCFATGNVSGDVNVGGIVGKHYGSSPVLKYCYSRVDATGTIIVGGLAGYVRSSSIINCYSTGKVIAPPGVARGLLGYISAVIIKKSFWDTETSGLTYGGGGVGKTTAQMKNINTYLSDGWDFMEETTNGTSDIWGKNNSENNGYPFLSWQGYTHVPCGSPGTPVSSIVLGDVLDESITLESYTGDADGYVIYIHNNENDFTAPINGSAPTANTAWGNGGQQCVYVGSSTIPNVTVSGLNTSCSTYYFKIYAYNVCSGANQYETTGAGTSAGGDIGDPVITSTHSDQTIDAAANCESALPDYIANVTATDNCTQIAGLSITQSPIAGTMLSGATNQVTITVTDIAGNNVSTNFNVAVTDNAAPVPDATTLSDLTGDCSVTITTAPTAGDNCSGTISGTSTHGTTPFTLTETSTIVWTYTDGAGNSVTQNQEVVLTDAVNPVPDIANLSDLTADCSVTVSTAPTANDNCSQAIITGTSTHGTTPFTIYKTGTIVWTYTDGAGNTVTQNQEVTIADTEVPVITCINNQTKEIASNETIYTVSGTEFDPVSNSDNCTVESIVNNFNNTETLNAAVFPTGTTTVTWTVADAAGNTANCSFDIAVSISNDIYELEKMGISIYPNPVSNILNINIGDGNIQRITITNILGKTVLNKLKTNKNERIDMSGFSSGIYIISIYKEQQIINHRIIKQ